MLDLLSAKPYGLLLLLDEEVRVPQGADSKWLGKCAERHAGCGAYGGPVEVQNACGFVVRHYAGAVTYDCRGMVEKNADRLSRNLHDALAASGASRKSRS